MKIRRPASGHRTQPKSAVALDRAIAEVAEVRYRNWGRDLSVKDRASHVDRALQALKDLGTTRPVYDKWTSLFYMTWYQFRQVNLVYSALKTQTFLKNQAQPLDVIDLGSGVGAVRVALAVWRAEADENGDHVEGVGVTLHGVEPSAPMRDLGRHLWREFGWHSRKFGLRNLAKRIDAMTGNYSEHESRWDMQARPSDPRVSEHRRWLTAVHAVYDSNVESLQAEIRRMRASWKPDVELISSDGEKDPEVKSLIRRGADRVLLTPKDWELRYTTRWRKKVLKDLGNCASDLTRSFLKGPVRADPGGNPIKEDSVYVWVNEP